jgi:hypothetical protein
MSPPATKAAAGAPHPHRTVSTVEGVAFLTALPLVTGAAIARLLTDASDVAIRNVAESFCTELNMLPPTRKYCLATVRSNDLDRTIVSSRRYSIAPLRQATDQVDDFIAAGLTRQSARAARAICRRGTASIRSVAFALINCRADDQ